VLTPPPPPLLPNTQGKVLIFIKKPITAKNKEGPLDVATWRDQVMCVEAGAANPYAGLASLASEVMGPMLSHTDNQRVWGEVPSRELLARFYDLVAKSRIVSGQVKGETQLPLPPIGGAAAGMSGPDKISLLEQAVITWTNQITQVLKADPEGAVPAGEHPTPDVEIDYWDSQKAALDLIWEQLQGPRVRRVLHLLDQAQSTYCGSFSVLCKEVFVARTKASDTSKYLRTLRVWFTKLVETDVSEFHTLTGLFQPILHIVLLIWKNSRYYNELPRLVTLLRQVCNAVIQQVSQFVSGESIFELIENEESAKAVVKLKSAITVCTKLKQQCVKKTLLLLLIRALTHSPLSLRYMESRAMANDECPQRPWSVPANAIFTRLDACLERLRDVLYFTTTQMQFVKLERMEDGIGGTKGKLLSAQVNKIYTDFLEANEEVHLAPFDLLDMNTEAYEPTYRKWKATIVSLEQLLAQNIAVAYADSPTVYVAVAVLSYEPLPLLLYCRRQGSARQGLPILPTPPPLTPPPPQVQAVPPVRLVRRPSEAACGARRARGRVQFVCRDIPGRAQVHPRGLPEASRRAAHRAEPAAHGRRAPVVPRPQKPSHDGHRQAHRPRPHCLRARRGQGDRHPVRVLDNCHGRVLQPEVRGVGAQRRKFAVGRPQVAQSSPSPHPVPVRRL